MAKAKSATTKASVVEAPKGPAKVKAQVMSITATPDELAQVFRVTDRLSQEEILRQAELPGVRLEFDAIHLPILDDTFVGMLPASAQKAYWLAKSEYDGRKREADRAIYETPNVVDPIVKLLDGPHGTSNPLVRDQAIVEKLLPGYYITWRIEGGQGDLENALRAGFRVMRRPVDDTERKEKDPTDWTGERWKVRDGTVDPTSGDEIFNVMVYIRERAWKDHLQAMSMISHNAYSTNKKQFVEGVDNISRDMLSSKERVQVVDLDEMHVEEHTMVVDGKRVQVDPRR